MLRLVTLGGLSLLDDAAPVTGAASQRSRLALLALLAAAGSGGVAREKVLASLWPESDDERARHALKQAVYALRRDLGSEHAIVGTATLSLDATIIGSDIRDFDDAIARGDDAAAIAVYGGPFLDGVFIRGAPEFDQWSAAERSRLERSYLDAIGRLAKSAEEAGDSTAAVGYWRRAAAAEPVSARVALSLMRALAESGDVSAAIQHARVHEALVRGELDLPPDEAVTALADELRGGRWTPPVRAPKRESAPREVQLPVQLMVDEPVRPSLPAEAPIVAPVRKRSPVMNGFLLVLGVMLAAAAGAYVKERLQSDSSSEVRSPRRIVVAPFINRTNDRALDPLGELAAQWLVRTLLEADFEVVDSRTAVIRTRLIARNTSAATPQERAAALAAQTGAATVVTGSYYRAEGSDSVQFVANVVDPARGMVLHAIGPLSAPQSAATSLVGVLANRLTAALAADAASNAGASTASLIEPPSVEAFEHASRGWEMFFSRPEDTTRVFAELARAAAIDTAYTTPLLMHGYILDVKERWSDLAAVVEKLSARRARMGRIEREVLAMFEADLRGDFLGRLRASRELLRLSPGSDDFALLLGMSAMYVNRASEAYATLTAASPDGGINQVSPMYWAWRGAVEHQLDKFDDELKSGRESMTRFPANFHSPMALARVHAVRANMAALDSLFVAGGGGTGAPRADAPGLALLAARELRAHGHPRQAASLFARIAAWGPPRGVGTEARELYALALYESGDLARAKAAYAAILAADPARLEALGRLGSIAARTGDSATVRAIDLRLAQWKAPYVLGEPSYLRARIAALTGRRSEALSLIHSAMEQGHRPFHLGKISLHEDGDFAALWTDPAFRELERPREGPAIVP